MKTVSLVMSLTIGGMVLASSVQAQEMMLGEFEYQNSCVACHGVSGKGDGPVTDFLSGAAVPDLTALQSRNGGVFPVTAVFNMIDGSDVASAHGTRDMPIWGKRFRERASAANDPDFAILDSEGYAKTRTLALIEYLASIQVQ